MDAYGVSEEDKSKIRALFNLTDNEVKLQVKVLKKWVLSRSDLPVDSQDEHFLNLMLLRSKFQLEVAKTLIENYFKYMSKYPEIFQNLGKFKPSEEIGISVTVPKMTTSFERVVIFKTMPHNMAIKPFDLRQLILIALTTSLLMYQHDYGHSMRCIFDFKKITMMHAFKLNLVQLYKFASIVQNMFKTKISGIEILNAPGIIPLVLSTGKLLLSKKIFSRITVHSDVSSLHKNIPIESLPSDYGGQAESTEELLEKWDYIIEAHQSFFEKIASLSQNDSNKNDET